MGDRTWWYEKCPKCGAEIEVYDAPSSLQWSKVCEKCHWSDGLDYYETGKNTIELLSKEEAQKRNLST